MDIAQIREKFTQLTRAVKLTEVPFDIVRDPLTDFLYDKTVPSDIFKAKQKRALVELMKIYRPDLDSGWEKHLTRLTQTRHRHKAVTLFKNEDLKSIEWLALYEWGKQLQIQEVDQIFEPKSLNVFTFNFWTNFEESYQEDENLFKAFSKVGLSHKDEDFLKEVYITISHMLRSKSNSVSSFSDNMKLVNAQS